MYAAVYATGGDAAVSNYSITASATFNGATLGTPLTGSSSGGGTAYATRTTTITSLAGYGSYVNNTQEHALDTCSGQIFPPFQGGNISGAATASLAVSAPTINGSSDMYLNSYDPSQGGNSYPAGVSYSANLNGASGTPHWTLTGSHPGYLSMSCAGGVQGVDCASVSLTPNSTAVASCSAAAILQYSAGGAPSVQVGILVRDGHQVVATSPYTGQHVDYIAVNNIYIGYQSNVYWQDIDSCGAQMSNAGGFETFPNGFQFDLPGTSGWGVPPNDGVWQTGANGGWYDNIGESCYHAQAPAELSAGPPPPPRSCSPLAQNPQSPSLGTTLVYDGAQNVYIGRPYTTRAFKLVFTGDQGHWLDHGGYVGQTTLYP
jgi:hypothetical protein